MSVTPRTVHNAILMPTAPRFRRVTGVTHRPFGTISLFLVATGILGLTSLCYLWQSGQATAAAVQIPLLNNELRQAQYQRAALLGQIYALKSPITVEQQAMKLGLTWHDQSTVYQINVAPAKVTRIVTMPGPAYRAKQAVHIAATTTTVTTWWQDAWVALNRLLR